MEHSLFSVAFVLRAVRNGATKTPTVPRRPALGVMPKTLKIEPGAKKALGAWCVKLAVAWRISGVDRLAELGLAIPAAGELGPGVFGKRGEPHLLKISQAPSSS